MRVAISSIAKMENNYVNEWIDYHLAIGFDHIFLFDNNDLNGERLSEVIKNTNVTIIEKFIGIPKSQKESNNYCYNTYGSKYDWIAFIDVDEFIRIDKNKFNNIKEFLSDIKFSNCDLVRLNWRLFDDSDNINVINNNYSINRFKQYSVQSSNEVKSIIKTGRNLNIECHGISKSNDCSFIAKDSEGNIIGCQSVYEDSLYGKWNNAWIDHYKLKSLEEFLKSRVIRGDNSFRHGRYKCSLYYYFMSNKITNNKIKFIQEFLKDCPEILKNKLLNTVYIEEWLNNLPKEQQKDFSISTYNKIKQILEKELY